ncbi:NAD(P)H-quinone oxidoreductase [Pseudomonas sp. LP_7_YM]|uniref:NAD(P)H-quinone oxidoreductase n=1 Tax=Pseudomonas sp. LP_7_YM TaxID=2485137 RepID=UPI001060D1FB|nr:NAD(P)H-quinone oxidoreductase [Pseudomonas sp. LP_7_YM]TDV59722.1 putative PIG3 family NAD(P)H quinone oxidoreductase [Pseudomonas sp. LP_7_YM]
MKVVVFEQVGGPEVLHLVERPEPHPAAGQVLIDVQGTALNYADLLQRRGSYVMKTDGQIHLGIECSGIITQLGTGVSGWKAGDKVCALLAGGGYGERVCVPATQLLPCPEGVPLLHAAALPEAACTLWSNLGDIARLQRGETVLIHGGAGGVGSLAVQWAHCWGARVLTTAGSPEKLRRSEAFGADAAIDYRHEDFVEAVQRLTDGRGVDVILDNMGAEYLARNIDALATDGRIVMIGLQSGREASIHLGKMMSKRATLHTTSLRDRSVAAKQAIVAGVLQNIWPHLNSGRMHPVIDRVFALSDVAAAHAYMETGNHVGKIVLDVKR